MYKFKILSFKYIILAKESEEAGWERDCLLYLFGDGFAVQFVVDLSYLGHSESRYRMSKETEGDLLFRNQSNRTGWHSLGLWVFTWRYERKPS